jgi:membrane-bound lytic murein transglycosylase D
MRSYYPIIIAILALLIVIAHIRYHHRDIFDKSKISSSEVAMPIEERAADQFELTLPDRLLAVSYDLPKAISFANEAVPLELPDVRERLDRELHINTYWHNNTIFLMKRANRWLPQIEAILEQHNVPSDFKYLPLIESGLLNDISPKNAVGFWQILRDSGKELGLEVDKDVDERYDPIKSTHAACKYLNTAYKKFGSWTLAAASYNRGMSGLDKALKNQQVENYYDLHMNDETSRYVFRILAIKEIIENPARYGFKLDPRHLYEEEPVRYVVVEENIKDLISWSKEQGVNYKILKRYNPWLRSESLSVRRGKSYQIAIPE